MARIARLVVPGLPHHVTQRGNRGGRIFFEDGDQDVFLRMLARHATAHAVEVWAYCLMPNHVHLILTPATETGLAKALGELHRQYTSFVNNRAGWTGHLFQGRYGSVVMDEEHLSNAVLYVTLNPVRAKLCAQATDWPWSSAHAHLKGRDDAVVRVGPVLQRFGDFRARLAAAEGRLEDLQAGFDALRRSEKTGRPVGSKEFLARLEAQAGRRLTPAKPGPKPVLDPRGS